MDHNRLQAEGERAREGNPYHRTLDTDIHAATGMNLAEWLHYERLTGTVWEPDLLDKIQRITGRRPSRNTLLAWYPELLGDRARARRIQALTAGGNR